MSEELKPCPWCGSNSVGMYKAATGESYVICRGSRDCRGFERVYGTPEHVTTNWNTRATDTELTRLRAALSPRQWTQAMHDAWHKALPDTQAAFEALTKEALKEHGK